VDGSPALKTDEPSTGPGGYEVGGHEVGGERPTASIQTGGPNGSGRHEVGGGEKDGKSEDHDGEV
jgi:hypothetical protein